MRRQSLLVVTLLTASFCWAQEQTTQLQLKTASSHPIEYYISLPQGWTSTKKWPVVVVIESANKEFEATARIFVQARQKMPFILVAPLVTTNGGPNYRQATTYHYSEATWKQVEGGRCRFDQEGIAAVIQDVQKLYSGEDRFFLAGWEAAGHTVWTTIFQHPEALRAAALVCPNYQGRCMDESGFSSSPARVKLPVKGFYGSANTLCAPGQPIQSQWTEAANVAAAHGFGNVSLQVVPGKDHTPLADEVLAYFNSLLAR